MIHAADVRGLKVTYGKALVRSAPERQPARR